MISIYILFLPLVIIMKVFEFLGMIGEKIEDFLIKIRINIIEFIFDKFIRKQRNQDGKSKEKLKQYFYGKVEENYENNDQSANEWQNRETN